MISIGQHLRSTYQVSWGLSLQPWFSLHKSPYLLLHYPSFGPLWDTHYRCQSNLVSTMYYKYTINPEGCTFHLWNVLQNADHFDLWTWFNNFNFQCTCIQIKQIPHIQSCRKYMTLHFLWNLEWILRSLYLSSSWAFVVIPSSLASTTLDIQGQILVSSLICTIMKPQFNMPKG